MSLEWYSRHIGQRVGDSVPDSGGVVSIVQEGSGTFGKCFRMLM